MDAEDLDALEPIDAAIEKIRKRGRGVHARGLADNKTNAVRTDDQRARLRALESEKANERIPAGARPGDGTFYARFVRVGQGDCIVMCTPGGTIVLVDCGSADTDGLHPADLRKLIRDALCTSPFIDPDGDPAVDIVVLTHSDEDHYNLLDPVLGPGITVDRIYYNAFSIGRFGAAQSWMTMACQDPRRIRKVVLDQEAPSPGSTVPGEGGITFEALADFGRPNAVKNVRPVDPVVGSSRIDRKDPAAAGIVIHEETGCTVTILAAGVQKAYEPDDDTQNQSYYPNRGSIVTLVEVSAPGTAHPSRRLLLCGDATKSTEKYLVARGVYHDEATVRLAGVTVAQIGHHGSYTSSDPDYLQILAPAEAAVCSTGRIGDPQHFLPRGAVLRRWLVEVQAGAPPGHGGFAWMPSPTARTGWASERIALPKAVFTTGSHGHYDIVWPTR